MSVPQSAPREAMRNLNFQQRYYDDAMKGFGVRVTSGGTKAFLLRN